MSQLERRLSKLEDGLGHVGMTWDGRDISTVDVSGSSEEERAFYLARTFPEALAAINRIRIREAEARRG